VDAEEKRRRAEATKRLRKELSAKGLTPEMIAAALAVSGTVDQYLSVKLDQILDRLSRIEERLPK
jgi:SOS response regulatory protein OraA/RecX